MDHTNIRTSIPRHHPIPVGGFGHRLSVDTKWDRIQLPSLHIIQPAIDRVGVITATSLPASSRIAGPESLLIGSADALLFCFLLRNKSSLCCGAVGLQRRYEHLAPFLAAYLPLVL